MVKKFKYLLILISIFFVTNVKAYTTDYININSQNMTINDESDNIVISNLSFVKRTLAGDTSFGLNGQIQNQSNNDINVSETATFYDINYNLVATINSSQFIGSFKTISYNQYKEGLDADNIAYYKLDITHTESFSNYDYTIDKYDIQMIVNDDNTFDITENITANFRKKRHGISRMLPLTNKVTRLDSSATINRVKITNISVNAPYTKSTKDGDLVLMIGDKDKTLTGLKNYIIKYKYNIGKDPLKDVDELYYNLVGNKWDTVLNDVTFTIKMPSSFDKSKLGFSSGRYGSANSDNIEYTVDGNIIKGKILSPLREEEGLTVRLTLPEGYFKNAKDNLDKNIIFSIIVCIILILITFIIWLKKGKQDKPIETVEFYPPEGMNSLDVGFAYRGNALPGDVTSLLIYLASKGYLKIKESDGETYFIKLKDYDGKDKFEKAFMEGLFKDSKKPSLSSLSNRFYKVTDRLVTSKNSDKNKLEIFESLDATVYLVILLFIAIIFTLITYIPSSETGNLDDFWMNLIFPGSGFTILLYMIFVDPGRNPMSPVAPTKAKSRLYNLLLGLLFGLGFGGIPFIATLWPILKIDSWYEILYLIGIISVIIIIFLSTRMAKRTEYGNEILGKIEGFKTFLKTAEKDKLEELTKENPAYFYDILPYAYVLGVSDKWISKFEKINKIGEPDWYESDETFDAWRFERYMNKTMDKIYKSSSSNKKSSSSNSSSSSSSSSSTGGGFSGGGSGGGGWKLLVNI